MIRNGLTASSYAARRPRLTSFILGQLSWQETEAFRPARRVSFSELLGGVLVRRDQDCSAILEG